MDKLHLLLQWLIDLERGGMLEHGGYTMAHLSFTGSVSQVELENMAEIGNLILEKYNCKHRIVDCMGEILPYVHNKKGGKKK